MKPLTTCRGILALVIGLVATPLISIAALFGMLCLRTPPAKAQKYPRFWGRLLCRLAGVEVKVEGVEHLDANQTYIFAGNHASQFDIFAFQGYFPHDFRWLAKKELFGLPFIGQAMRAIGCVPIDRGRSRRAVVSLKQAARRIASGTSVLIFPEGTRSPDGRLRSFKGGAILLAIRAQVPLVPIGFNGTAQVLPKGSLLARPGHVTIRIGPPLTTETLHGRDREQLAAKLHDAVAALLTPEHLPVPLKKNRESS